MSRGWIFISATAVGLRFYPSIDLVTPSSAQCAFSALGDFVPRAGGSHVGGVCTAMSALVG